MAAKKKAKETGDYTIKVSNDDSWYMEVNQAKRRLLIKLCETPTRPYFLERWGLIAAEVAQLDTISNDPIDLIFDYTEAKPIPNALKILIFTKTLGMAMGYPNSFVWRIIPGDPKKNLFFQQVLEAVPNAWLGFIKASPKHFPTRKSIEAYLDKLRAKKHKGLYCIG